MYIYKNYHSVCEENVLPDLKVLTGWAGLLLESAAASVSEKLENCLSGNNCLFVLALQPSIDLGK